MISKTFEYPLMIRESHVDTLGHVNNATYLEIFEDARWDLITKNGYGLKEVHENQKSPIILEINLQFKKEVKCREETVVKTKCLDYATKVGRLEQILFNSKNEEACVGVITFAFFDMQTRKIIAPTQAWLKAIGLE